MRHSSATGDGRGCRPGCGRPGPGSAGGGPARACVRCRGLRPRSRRPGGGGSSRVRSRNCSSPRGMRTIMPKSASRRTTSCVMRDDWVRAASESQSSASACRRAPTSSLPGGEQAPQRVGLVLVGALGRELGAAGQDQGVLGAAVLELGARSSTRAARPAPPRRRSRRRRTKVPPPRPRVVVTSPCARNPIRASRTVTTATPKRPASSGSLGSRSPSTSTPERIASVSRCSTWPARPTSPSGAKIALRARLPGRRTSLIGAPCDPS